MGFVWTGSLVAALLIHTGGGSFQAPLSGACLGMAPGGAGGNVLDLLVRKAVIDYVEIGAWPAFNLADVAIIAGVILALVSR